jgi:short-subunit dehydrogenase
MKSMYFISGATGGLGKAFTVECASRGWDLFLTDLQSDKLAALTGGLENTYKINVRFQACDLTDVNARSALLDSLRSRGLRFRGLINVAGLDYEGLFLEKSREQIRNILRLNIEATLEITHTLLDLTDPITPFRIITVSSLAAFYPMPVKATYAASKRFLLDFFLALRDEVDEHGATVTVLCPAGLPTTEECIQAIEAQGLMGQLTTQDIGKVAAQTVEAALRGRALVIPGILNQTLHQLGGLLPPSSLVKLIGKRWRTAHRRRLEIAVPTRA